MSEARKTAFPIYQIEPALLEALAAHRRVILTAPTGSGKSTQIPQILLDRGLLGRGQVMILQPRRLAARLLARWVAQSREAKLGGEVGYQMRLENTSSRATLICYVTEGVLLRRMVEDPGLSGISAIVFDEFHERHLYGDVTLARALQIQQSTRPDLSIIVMSATLDVAPVEKRLRPCAILSAPGRAYPVAIEYLAQPAGERRIWDLAVRELRRLVREHPQGDALVFMPGTYEIARTVEAARAMFEPEFVVLPLHGALPPADQDAAVGRYDRRKIVVATNVAQTSLTIDGVRLVIDSGLARIPRYDPYRGINTLLVEKISRAAADQRAGRAGRTAPGTCVRLWTVHENSGRAAHDTPEVKRLDLCEVVLMLKASGFIDVKKFPWLEAPEPRALERAEMLLRDLGAIERDTGATTELGRRMLVFPAHPRYARMLLAAGEQGCARAVALIAALTQGRSLLGRDQRSLVEKDGDDPSEATSDFFPLMRAWRYAARHRFDVDRCRQAGMQAQAAREVALYFEQFLKLAARDGWDVGTEHFAPEAVQRCILLGFIDHLAKRVDDHSRRCELVHGRRGVLARESVVRAPLFVAAEVRETESGGRRERPLEVVLNLATAAREEWLAEYFPDDFSESREVLYDPALRRVVRRRQRRFRDLVLGEEISYDPPAEEAERALAREIAGGRGVLKNWNEEVEQWLLRIQCLRGWMPELGLPEIGPGDREGMLRSICRGAFTLEEVQSRPVLPVVKSWLNERDQRLVDQHAPERIQLPRGRRVKIVYSASAPPAIAARIQDLYGVEQGLRIAAGRVPVRIHVLAPSNRPVQVTENLALFWRETYPKLKQQLQRRYPKHEWR